MVKDVIIGNKNFNIGKHIYIMGILNVTPDSFSDGGKFNSIDTALKHAQELINDGTDIIDIGGESTRPNYSMISDEEEIERVVPIIEKIKQNFDIPVSIDTYKSKVAENAVLAGADLINDIWGLKYDINIASVAKKYNSAICIMHNRNNTNYSNFIQDVINDLKCSINIAKSNGISDNKIIIDPGVGFAKSYENNIEIISNLEKLLCLNYPILLGTSRKSVIGLTLNLPVNERLEGTITTNILGAIKGCHFIRVHDVKSHFRALKMLEALV